jgi:hypothetical protein
LLTLVLLAGSVSPVSAQGRGPSLFPVDENVLALWEFDGHSRDISGNGRDGTLLGGEFVTTPFGRGMRVGEDEETGLDWSTFAPLLEHPFTVEMILFPEDTSAWRKLFSFDDRSDHGWYYRSEGIQSYPNPTLGAGGVVAQEWAYIAFVSTAPDEIEVFLNGESLGRTPTGFAAPPPQAIFFRDDLATGRGEQLEGIVEALRISDVARQPGDLLALQNRLLQGGTGARPIIESIPTPQEVEFTPEVVGTNIGLALFLALGFGVVSTLFNSTLKENAETVTAAWQRRMEPLFRRLPASVRGRPSFADSWSRHWSFTLLLLLLSALIYAFLDPTFVPGLSGLPLFLSLFLSLLVITYSYDFMQGWLARRFFGRSGRLEAFPVILLIAVGCVLLSRLLSFQPGYLLGFVAAFVLSSDPAAEGWRVQRENALLIIGGGALLLLTALAAWLLSGVTGSVPFLHGTLALIFVAGLEGVLFALLPLEFLDGWLVYEWNRVAWFGAFAVATYWFCQILLNPASSYLEAFAQTNVQLALLLLALYALLTVVLWLIFRRSGAQTVVEVPVHHP